MKAPQGRFAVRTVVAAVHGALASLAFAPALAAADEADVAALTKPTSEVEVGGLYVNKDSAKFGEFSGLDQKGAYAIGNFRLFGGDGDAGTLRWNLFGTNLGLDSRSITGEVGNQGRWRVTGGYDEIVRNAYDTYQTFYNGAGGTSFTLPAGYPAASTRLAVTNNAGAILANWNNIQTPNATATSTGGGPAQVIPANMHEFDIGTKRKIGNVAVSTIFAPGWEFSASVRREEKDGTKLTGVNIGRFSGVSTLLPEPIDSTTDQFTAQVAFADQKWNFSVGYYGSIYRNDVKLWTVENPGANNVALNNVARLQSYPDNQMHQINASGGYRFTPTTRLQVTAHWTRMTQDDSFIDNPVGSTWVVPETSPHAKIVQKFLYARLMMQPAKNLRVNAAYRLDDRDNQTPIMQFATTAGDLPGASTLFNNEPINRKVQTANLEGEYTIARGQAVRAEYEYQSIRRTADSEESPFRADKTYENTARLEYRKSLSDSLTGRVSYAYSQRRVKDYEEGNPRPTSPPAPLPAADPLLGGFEQFFLADRDRNKLRGILNLQASQSVSLTGSLDYNQDKYKPLFGLKESRSWVGNVDASYAADEKLSFTLFYTYEDMKMQLDSLAIARGTTATTLVPHVSGPPCAPYTNVANTLPADYFTDSCRLWSAAQTDKVHTLGFGTRYRGLLGGRLDLGAELAYSRAISPVAVSGGTYYNTGVPSSPTGNVFIAAENLPDVKTELTQLRLNGVYAIDKKSAVRVQYIYGRLKSNDWAWDAFANSPQGVLAVQNFIGPAIVAPNYNVSVIGVSYIYRFR